MQPARGKSWLLHARESRGDSCPSVRPPHTPRGAHAQKRNRAHRTSSRADGATGLWTRLGASEAPNDKESARARAVGKASLKIVSSMSRAEV